MQYVSKDKDGLGMYRDLVRQNPDLVEFMRAVYEIKGVPAEIILYWRETYGENPVNAAEKFINLNDLL